MPVLNFSFTPAAPWCPPSTSLISSTFLVPALNFFFCPSLAPALHPPSTSSFDSAHVLWGPSPTASFALPLRSACLTTPRPTPSEAVTLTGTADATTRPPQAAGAPQPAPHVSVDDGTANPMRPSCAPVLSVCAQVVPAQLRPVRAVATNPPPPRPSSCGQPDSTPSVLLCRGRPFRRRNCIRTSQKVGRRQALCTIVAEILYVRNQQKTYSLWQIS